MAHNLFGNRFYGKRTPAWHGLGRTFTDSPSATEALVEADMDYLITPYPVVVEYGSPDDGYRPLDAKRFALVREPTADDPQPRVFSVVSSRYEVVQNRDVAKYLDPITDFWPVETLGALGMGETIFYTLDAGEFEVAGDAVHRYLLVTDKRDGNSALKIAYTPVRVVCANTLSMALDGTVLSASINHLANPIGQLSDQMEHVRRMLETFQRTDFLFGQMAKTVRPLADFEALLERVYPAPLSPVSDEEGYLETYQRQVDAHAARLGAVRELFGKFNDEQPGLAMTPWACYNAIVEMEDYRIGRAAQANWSALTGERAKIKQIAFAEALRLTN